MIAPLMFTGPEPWMSTVAPLRVRDAVASTVTDDALDGHARAGLDRVLLGLELAVAGGLVLVVAA